MCRVPVALAMAAVGIVGAIRLVVWQADGVCGDVGRAVDHPAHGGACTWGDHKPWVRSDLVC